MKTPETIVGSDESKKVRKSQALGCLMLFFVTSIILGILSFVPNLVMSASNLLNQAGISLPSETAVRIQDATRTMVPFGIGGTIILIIYVIGKSAGVLSKMGGGENPPTVARQNPIAILLSALLKVIGQIFSIVSVTADAIEEMAEGLLESFEYLYDIIERLLEYDIFRIFIAGIFSVLGLAWVYLTIYFVSDYLITENLFSALWMLGSAGIAFLNQVCLIGVVKKRPFRELALRQLRALSIVGSFVLLLYLPIYFVLTQINSFLQIGPITKFMGISFAALSLFELGRRIQQSVKERM